MKKLGFFLIAIGIAIGLLLPWAQLNFKGEEIAQIKFEYFDTTSSSENQMLKPSASPPENTVLLKREDNPIRVRFLAEYKVGAQPSAEKIPVIVKLSDKDGTLIGTIVSFSANGHGGSDDQPNVRTGNSLNVTVQNDGLHKLHLTFPLKNSSDGVGLANIERITATFVGNASTVNSDYQIPALVLAMLGFYLVLRSRRSSDGKPNKHRWGRG